jgi:uncharacterized protein (DUF111 family)
LSIAPWYFTCRDHHHRPAAAEVQRWTLARERVEVETPYSTVGVKVARLGGKGMTASPEYKDCRRLALESGVPLKEVYVAAEAALRQMDLPLDADRSLT